MSTKPVEPVVPLPGETPMESAMRERDAYRSMRDTAREHAVQAESALAELREAHGGAVLCLHRAVDRADLAEAEEREVRKMLAEELRRNASLRDEIEAEVQKTADAYTAQHRLQSRVEELQRYIEELRGKFCGEKGTTEVVSDDAVEAESEVLRKQLSESIERAVTAEMMVAEGIVARSYQQVIRPLDMTITLEYATREAFQSAAREVHDVNAARGKDSPKGIVCDRCGAPAVQNRYTFNFCARCYTAPEAGGGGAER